MNGIYKTLAITIAVVCTFLSADLAGGTVLKIATLSPDGSSWMKKMRDGADEVARKTNKRVRFKFYPGGVMGDDKAVLRKIRIRQLHGGALTAGSIAKFYPDSQVYSLPVKFRSFDELDYVRARMDRSIMDGFEKGGFVTFGLAEAGFAYLMSRSSITTIDILRSQKVWIPDNDMMSLDTVRAFGVSPIPLPVSEVRTALQTGLINTVGMTPIGAIAFQWHTQVSYVTDIPLIYIYAVLAVDRKSFEKISPADRKIVREVMGRVFKEINNQNRADNIRALEVLKKQGIKFVDPESQSLRKLKELSLEVEKKLMSSGQLSKDIVGTMESHLMEYRKKHPGSHE